MRLTWTLGIFTALLAANPVLADESKPALASLKLHLAAAEASGDPVSDVALLKMFPMVLGYQPDLDSIDREVLDRVFRARVKLAESGAAALETDPTVLALELRCLPGPGALQGCPARMDRLSRLAGDNAYHHIVLMGMAAALEDQQAVGEHAARAAQAADYKHDLTTVFASLHARYAQVPDSLWQQVDTVEGQSRSPGVEAMAYAAAIALPHYKFILDACREAEGELAAHCLEVGRKMVAESGVMIDIHIGAKLVGDLGNEADREEAQQALRNARWLGRALSTADGQLNDSQWDQFYETYAREGEMAATRYAAEVQGMALTPPDGWTGEPEARPAS